jgi:hypothetical protein
LFILRSSNIVRYRWDDSISLGNYLQSLAVNQLVLGVSSDKASVHLSGAFPVLPDLLNINTSDFTSQVSKTAFAVVMGDVGGHQPAFAVARVVAQPLRSLRMRVLVHGII